MYRPTHNIQQAKTDSLVLGLALMAVAALVWIATRFLSR
jgi:hypothetical protein